MELREGSAGEKEGPVLRLGQNLSVVSQKQRKGNGSRLREKVSIF